MIREIKIHPKIIEGYYPATIDLSYLIGRIEMCLWCKGKGKKIGRNRVAHYCTFCNGKGRVKFS